MKVKTQGLISPALDWAVAKCEGHEKRRALKADRRRVLVPHPDGGGQLFRPSTDWEQGGPIIEREAHNLFKHNGGTEWCCAVNVPRDGYTAIITADGPTPLIAAMRCHVTSKLGYEVDVPDELFNLKGEDQ